MFEQVIEKNNPILVNERYGCAVSVNSQPMITYFFSLSLSFVNCSLKSRSLREMLREEQSRRII